MPDGSIYAGVSPNTGKAMYVTPADAPLAMKKLVQQTMTESVKKIRLHFGLYKEPISVAGESLQVGGWVEAPRVSAEVKVGDKMPDGTIYAGVSSNTGKAIYATPADASLTMNFNEANEYAAKLDAHGHKDWHVPTKAELNVLFNNRAAIGGFNVTGSGPAGWYWSSSQSNKWNASVQRFSDGEQFNLLKDIHLSVRCVR